MNLGSIQHLNWAQKTLVCSDLCVCCSVNVWATLNVSLEIYNSATQDDRTHTGNKTSTRRDTHRPTPQPPHSIRHLPITSSYKMQPDNSWCSWISGKCSATFLHYLLGLILRPVLGINIQLYFLGSHISVFLVKYLSVFFRTGSTSFQWAFHTI